MADGLHFLMNMWEKLLFNILSACKNLFSLAARFQIKKGAYKLQYWVAVKEGLMKLQKKNFFLQSLYLLQCLSIIIERRKLKIGIEFYLWVLI